MARSSTNKYSIPDDHEWEDVEAAWEDIEKRATVDTHEVDVIHQHGDDPMWDRRKYTVHISHSDPDPPTALYAIPHRFKGNYWREADDMDDWVDWADLPYLVRRKVAQLVACEGIGDLAPNGRLVNPEETDE